MNAGFLGVCDGRTAGREGKAGRVVVGFTNTLRWFFSSHFFCNETG